MKMVNGFHLLMILNTLLVMILCKGISPSNHMFKKEIWEKFTNLSSKTREISKFKKNEQGNLPNFTNKHVIPG